MKLIQSKWWIAAFAIFHFLLERTLFLYTFAAGMKSFDAGNATTALETAADTLSKILAFPIATLALVGLPTGWFPSLSGYVFFVLNSCLWGWITWLLLRPKPKLH